MIKTCCHGTVPNLMGSDVNQGSREKKEKRDSRDEQWSCLYPYQQWADVRKRSRPEWTEFCSTLGGHSKGEKAGPCSLTPPPPEVSSLQSWGPSASEPHAARVQEPRQLVKWDLSEPRALSPTTRVTQAHTWGLPNVAQVSAASYVRRKVATQGWSDMSDCYLRYGNRYHKIVKFKLYNI